MVLGDFCLCLITVFRLPLLHLRISDLQTLIEPIVGRPVISGGGHGTAVKISVQGQTLIWFRTCSSIILVLDRRLTFLSHLLAHQKTCRILREWELISRSFVTRHDCFSISSGKTFLALVLEELGVTLLVLSWWISHIVDVIVVFLVSLVPRLLTWALGWWVKRRCQVLVLLFLEVQVLY